MRIGSFVVALSSFAIIVVSAACNASPPEEERPTPVVEGAFQLETADANAAVQEIEFRGDRYWLVPAGCKEVGCRERGTFTIDPANKLLTLVVEGTDRSYRLPFEVTSTRGGAGVIESSKPTALVEGNGNELVGQQKLTANSVALVERSYVLIEGYDDCGNRDMLTIARALCASIQMPTQDPVKKCVLMNDQDNCNGASMRSCLKDTETNNAETRWNQYMADCNGGDQATETRGSLNYGLNPFAMIVCCKGYTCPGGTTIDGTPVTGSRGQTVCGLNGSKWWCGPGGKTEGVGAWKDLGKPCN